MLKLSPHSLDWALNQAELLGDTDIFPLPFEFSAIRHDWDRLRRLLASRDLLAWQARPHRDCLSPKSFHGFRVATQLDPLDWLVYTALIYEIGSDLESYRLSQSKSIVFSWRFDPLPDGTMFSRTTGFRQFQKRALELAKLPANEYVVATDITDFYPMLYHHRIQNALNSAATSKKKHTKAVMQLLGAWRERQSFGLPVGPNASRLIAETAIHDVDQALLGAGFTFVRFVDDFRIFCRTRRHAYHALATLAEILWKNHGLTLSERKTDILPSDVFETTYFNTGREVELDHLVNSFRKILDKMGIDDPYELLEYDYLDDDDKAIVDGLNLGQLLSDQLKRSYIDIPLTKFILRRLSQTQHIKVTNTILRNIDKLYPVFVDVVAYLTKLKITPKRRAKIGQYVIELLKQSTVSHLEYHRLHMLNMFASTLDWNNFDSLLELWPQYSDPVTRRKLILALGKAGQDYWFRQRKTEWQQFSHWERRAFLRGASSLEEDERRHWYRSVRKRLDPLEVAIVSWSNQSPIYV